MQGVMGGIRHGRRSIGWIRLGGLWLLEGGGREVFVLVGFVYLIVEL